MTQTAFSAIYKALQEIGFQVAVKIGKAPRSFPNESEMLVFTISRPINEDIIGKVYAHLENGEVSVTPTPYGREVERIAAIIKAFLA